MNASGETLALPKLSAICHSCLCLNEMLLTVTFNQSYKPAQDCPRLHTLCPTQHGRQDRSHTLDVSSRARHLHISSLLAHLMMPCFRTRVKPVQQLCLQLHAAITSRTSHALGRDHTQQLVLTPHTCTALSWLVVLTIITLRAH